MNLFYKTIYALLFSFILVGCISTEDDKTESTTSSQEYLIKTTSKYDIAYYTSFVHQNGNNLYEDNDGNLHIAYVDNYELFYAKSTNDGKTWSNEKIPTGHDGALRRASLVVDGNGKVFIGFETHDKFNYANETSVSYGSNFEYDLYCANNLNGVWAMELIYTHESGTSGREVMSMDVDAQNNIYMFAQYYGWWNYGGKAYEYIRSNNTWNGATQIAYFSDTYVDKFIYNYASTNIKSNGDITFVANRQGSTPGTDDKLFYVQKINGVWNSPINIETTNRANHGTYQVDAAMDSNNNIYLAYLKDNTDSKPQILFRTNFGNSEVIYNPEASVRIHSLKLHSDSAGNLTLVINYDDEKSIILTKSINAQWSGATEIETLYTDGVMYTSSLVKTNTAQSYFTTFKMSYLEDMGTISDEVENGPFNLYFYNHNVADSSIDDASSSSTDTGDDSSTDSQEQEITVSHLGGVDFSESSSTSDWEQQDGYTTAWSQTGIYADGEGYNTGIWYNNNASDTDYAYIQEIGAVDLDSVSSINEQNWLTTTDAIPSLKIDYVYVVKTRDGYAKFKVSSLSSSDDIDWSFTADYVYSSTTSF